MTRYNNPYAGLSDGIQQGLRSWAQADVAKSEHGVRMAQMQLDKQQRDQDYNLRLANHELNKNQDRRAQAESDRNEYVHRMTQLERTRKEFESKFSLIQNDDGTIDWKNPNAQKVISDTNFMLKNDPYAVETIKTVLGVRTGDKDTLQLELMPDGSGLAAVTSSSKDPSINGVFTENASKDPNDRVVNVPGESVRQIVNITKKAEMLGTSPAATAYFLHESFGLGGNGQFEVTPEIEQQAQALGAELERGITADAIADGGNPNAPTKPVSTTAPITQKLAQVPPQSEPPTGPKYKNIFGQRSGLATAGAFVGNVGTAFGEAGGAVADSAVNVGNKAVDTARGWAGEFMYGMSGDQAQPVEPPTSSASPAPTQQAPAKTEAPAQSPVNERGHITVDPTKPGTNTQELFANFSQTIVGKAAKISEADRRAFFAAAADEKRHQKAMGRYLLSESLKPSNGMTSAQAANLYENGRGNVLALDQLARQQPSETEVIMKWMASGGAKGQTEDGRKARRESLDRKSKFVNSVTTSINSARGDKGEPPMYDPAVSGGIDDALAYMGNLNPEDQEMFLLEHEGNLRAAMATYSQMESRFRADGRKARAAMAQTFVATVRQGAYMPPPNVKTPEDQQVYMDQSMELFAAYSDDPLAEFKVGKAMELYHEIVKQYGFGKVSIGEIVSGLDKTYQPKK